ncbi:MAG TPA: DUF6470 family protein [Candidatus Dormibacteraeota bacterium]|nr:DUF6470 family protein [Candidatus Dormibacteraeota bacterium]
MNFPQIQMQSQMGQIEISQTRGKQEITQPKAEPSIKQPSAEMEIGTTPSRLTIDQTKAWEDMNLMSVLRSSEKFAEEGATAIQEGTARRAEQGRQMMEIEHQEQIFVNQAISNSKRPSKNLNIAFIPSSFAVKIDYKPSQVHIDVQRNDPIIDAIPHYPEHHYNPGEVSIKMAQYPYLEIDVADTEL